MNAPVMSGHSSWHKDKKGASTTTLPRNEASETVCPCWLTSAACWAWAGSDEALGRRGAPGAEGAAGAHSAEEAARRMMTTARRGTAQRLRCRPHRAGRKVKGRSARVIRVEAIQRVRSSKTGAIVEVSSSCCSLKWIEPS